MGQEAEQDAEGCGVTAGLREAYKRAIDAAVREREIVPGQPRCDGCGTDLDCYTDECLTCWNRRRGRKRRATTCSGCGCPLDEKRVGCKACRNRHSNRRVRRAA